MSAFDPKRRRYLWRYFRPAKSPLWCDLCRYYRDKRENCSSEDTQSIIAKYLSALKTLFTARLFIRLSLVLRTSE